MWIALLREKRTMRPETDRCRRFPTPRTQAAAVFDIGEEYEFEIIRDDDGDGSLTLSVRKIRVRVARDSSNLVPRPPNRTTLKPEEKTHRRCPTPLTVAPPPSLINPH